MSDETSQLSVAELLARNGQEVPSTGGGRRRRGGRGIAVTELTGDLPAVSEGGSAHAASDPGPAPQSPAPADPSRSGPVDGYHPPAPPVPSSVEPSKFESSSASAAFDSKLVGSTPSESASDRSVPFESRSSAANSVELPSYTAPAVPNSDRRDPSGFGWQAHRGSGDAPGDFDRRPAVPEAAPGGRRARRERMDALSNSVSLAELEGTTAPPQSPADSPETRPAPSGRRRRREADEQTVDVPPFKGQQPQPPAPVGPPTMAWAPTRVPPAQPPAPARPGPAESGPGIGPGTPGSNGPGSIGHGLNGLNGSGPNGHGPGGAGSNGVGPNSPGLGGEDAQPTTLLPRGARRNGPDGLPPELPAWSARRRQPPPAPAPPPNRPAPDAAAPTAFWPLAGRDQQLVSGQTVAGDLLRDAAARAQPPAPGPRGAPGRPNGPGLLEDDEDYDDEDDFLDDYDEDDDFDDREPRGARLLAAGSRFAARTRSVTRGRGSGGPNRGAGAASERDHQRQWMILAGQVVGAAVVGMLLFKGFEKMWDIFPMVALALAMVVVLGLVALVRVLRRTDDLYSTVIAVIVGIFVTLGPLAFLLSTN